MVSTNASSADSAAILGSALSIGLSQLLGKASFSGDNPDKMDKIIMDVSNLFDDATDIMYDRIEKYPKDKEYDPDEELVSSLELLEDELRKALNRLTKDNEKEVSNRAKESAARLCIHLINKMIDLRWEILTRDGLIAFNEKETEEIVSGEELVEFLRSE